MQEYTHPTQIKRGRKRGNQAIYFRDTHLDAEITQKRAEIMSEMFILGEKKGIWVAGHMEGFWVVGKVYFSTLRVIRRLFN